MGTFVKATANNSPTSPTANKENPMAKEQPTQEQKLATLRGEETGWGYWMQVPPVSTHLWNDHDWIRFIGTNWFLKTNLKEAA